MNISERIYQFQINMVKLVNVLNHTLNILNLMAKWIWEECLDEYGLCIRQYSTCFLSLIIAIYSVGLTFVFYRKYRPLLRFELIPLSINSITSVGMFVLTVFQQIYSTNIVQLLVQIYSYSLFTYTYIAIFYKAKHYNQQKNAKIQKILNIAMVIFTLLLIIVIIAINILSYQKKITCYDEHGTAAFALIFMLLPLYFTTLIYIKLTKKKLRDQFSSHYTQEHLLSEQDDQYIQMKLTEGTFTIAFFTISVLLHIAQISLFIFLNQEFTCNRNALIVKSPAELIILSFQDIGQLLPHFAIPFTWVLLPIFYNRNAATVYIDNIKGVNSLGSGNKIKSFDPLKSNFVQGMQVEKKIRKKLKGQQTSEFIP